MCLGICRHSDVKVWEICFYSYAVTNTHTEALFSIRLRILRNGILPYLLIGWICLLRIWSRTIYSSPISVFSCAFSLSSLEASQQCYVTTFTAVFKQTVAANLWRQEYLECTMQGHDLAVA